MPGVYSRPTTYNRVFLKEQFMLALNTAFSIPQVSVSSCVVPGSCCRPSAAPLRPVMTSRECRLQAEWRKLMDAATQARFPVELWSERLDALYTSAAEMHYSCKPDAAAERQYNRTLKMDPMAIEVCALSTKPCCWLQCDCALARCYGMHGCEPAHVCCWDGCRHHSIISCPARQMERIWTPSGDRRQSPAHSRKATCPSSPLDRSSRRTQTSRSRS
jgi:hypothetical protein